MSFTRVHNGVAFATYERLTSADLNTIRTDIDHFQVGNTRNLTSRAFDGEAIISATPTSGTLGSIFWSDFWASYVALALPRGSTGPGYYVLAAPGGRAEVMPIATLPSGISTTNAVPTLITAKYRDAENSMAAMLYADAAGGTGVAESTNMASWTRVYYGGSALGATLTRLPSVALASGDVATPVMNIASRPAFIRTYAYDGHVSCPIVSGGTATGSPYAVAVNTDRNLVMCLAGTSLHACVYDDVGKSFNTYATPMHADTVGTPSSQKIAYDPLLERFVLVTPGNSADPLTSGYLYWVTNDGKSAWSSTEGWKRAYLGYQNLIGAPFLVQDFTITQDGAWVLLVVDKRPLSLQLNLMRVLMSFDQGATWNEYGSWPHDGSYNTRLSQGGPGLAIIDTSTYVDWVSVSGAAQTATTIISESL